MKPKADIKLKFDGSGGLTYNPNNSRKSVKIILPNKFTDKVKTLILYSKDGAFSEKLYRKTPNEYDNRMRFYGKKKISEYPKPFYVQFEFNKKIYEISVKDPAKRQD